MLKKLNKIEYLFYFIGTLFLLISLLTYFVVKDASLDIDSDNNLLNHVTLIIFLSCSLLFFGSIYHSNFISTKETKTLSFLHLVLSSVSIPLISYHLFFISFTEAPRRYYSRIYLNYTFFDLNIFIQIGTTFFVIAQLIFITNITLTLLKKRNENNLL